MLAWIESFFSEVFGNFWGHLATLAIKLLVGPFVFFVFGPMFKLSGYVTEKILAQIQPALDDVGISLDGVAAWFIEMLRIQECISMFMTFMVLGLSVSLIRRFI